MELIEANFRVVTPLFLGEHSDGNSNQPFCAENIRGASIKGALRAAFRSLYWSSIRGKENNRAAALKELHRQEADLFGAAAKVEGDTVVGGQAKFLLRIQNNNIRTSNGANLFRAPQVQYLLGMGLYHFRDGLLRSYIIPDSEFTLELALKPQMSETQKKQLINTIKLFGLLGNLGSRARKGFGSITITALSHKGQTIALPNSREEYIRQLSELITASNHTELPPLTAFYRDTVVQVSGQDRNPMQLLHNHGNEMGMYRGFGRNHNGARVTFDRPAEQNFRADHDWAYQVGDGQILQNIPQRTVFGLPHPYRLSNGTTIKVDASSERRASPLFAHVHALPNGQHLLIHSIMKSEFLPERASVKVQSGRSQPFYINDIEQQINWGVLENFLARFNQGERING